VVTKPERVPLTEIQSFSFAVVPATHNFKICESRVRGIPARFPISFGEQALRYGVALVLPWGCALASAGSGCLPKGQPLFGMIGTLRATPEFQLLEGPVIVWTIFIHLKLLKERIRCQNFRKDNQEIRAGAPRLSERFKS
jgi:hypothetical protein